MTPPDTFRAAGPPPASNHGAILAVLLGVLAVGISTASLLGPLVTGLLAYRTSDTTLNQVVGGDLAGLVVVAPTALTAAALVRRGHRLGPVLALAPGLWAVYMYLQLLLGQEYLQLPGNNERFFPLLLGLVVLGEAIIVLAWRAADVTGLTTVPPRLERTAGTVLLALAAFLVVGLHLPTLVDALTDQPTALEYTSSPTAFWVVKVMDLGIIVPAAVAIGIGLRRHATWARKPAFALFGAYTLLGTGVAGMAVVMVANDDPDGSITQVLAFVAFVVALGWLTVRLYRPLIDVHTARDDAAHRVTTP